jgi:hypothetical protein
MERLFLLDFIWGVWSFSTTKMQLVLEQTMSLARHAGGKDGAPLGLLRSFLRSQLVIYQGLGTLVGALLSLDWEAVPKATLTQEIYWNPEDSKTLKRSKKGRQRHKKCSHRFVSDEQIVVAQTACRMSNAKHSLMMVSSLRQDPGQCLGGRLLRRKNADFADLDMSRPGKQTMTRLTEDRTPADL